MNTAVLAKQTSLLADHLNTDNVIMSDHITAKHKVLSAWICSPEKIGIRYDQNAKGNWDRIWKPTQTVSWTAIELGTQPANSLRAGASTRVA